MSNPRGPFGFVNKILTIFIYVYLGITIATSSTHPLVQQRLDKVLQLPGQNFNVSFAHYAGYITVNEDAGRALFYWFIEATKDPDSKPLVLWLNGGPGCSSIAYGEAEEIGPFHIKPDGKTLYLNPYSWNKVANLIFLDSPVGVGFSYSKNSSDVLNNKKKKKKTILVPPNVLSRYSLWFTQTTFALLQLPILYFLIPLLELVFSYSKNSSDVLNNGDKRTAEDSLAFLLKWFERFPQFKGRDFYITGESYAGHYVPQLSQAIVRYKIYGIDSVGNALTDDHHDHLGVFQFLWTTGLISDQTYRQLNLLCAFQPFLNVSEACYNILVVASTELGNIDQYSIFTPPCPANVSQSNRLKKRMNHMVGYIGMKYDPCTADHAVVYFNLPSVQKALHVDPARAPSPWSTCRYIALMVGYIGMKYDPCTADHAVVYFNLPSVQKALHVDPARAPSPWSTCSELVNTNWKDSPQTMLDVYHELIHSGLRIWMLSGDTDSVIPVTATRMSIDALKLATLRPWRAWYDDGQVGGWTQDYAGLTYVTVRGAGHEVPLHKPKLALALIKAFLSGNSTKLASA
ncbi:serine carboxypeptidase-like 29 [Quercus suber]|uniref:serine carboxypeptidase-like 29 n=1 Tax=Quercus suber TaxID=58331 RepID=UPI0032E01858